MARSGELAEQLDVRDLVLLGPLQTTFGKDSSGGQPRSIDEGRLAGQ